MTHLGRRLLAAFVCCLALLSSGCWDYLCWRVEQQDSKARRLYAKRVGRAAEADTLLGTWEFQRPRPDQVYVSKTTVLKPDSCRLSLFCDHTFVVEVTRNTRALFRLDRRKFCQSGTWKKSRPGLVMLTYEGAELPEEVDLRNARNVFVRRDRELKK